MTAPRPLRMVVNTWFGAGYFPVASGTFGTLATVPLVLLLAWLDSAPVYLAVTALVTLLGIWTAWPAKEDFGRPDPGEVVVDEAAGFLVTMALLPITPWTLLAGFLLFRVADVVKPFPARRLESLPRGLGIVADDIMAGLYAQIALRIGLAVLERPPWT